MIDFLTLNNFSCGYKNAFKLSDINFTVPKGYFAGIVGPNGSGKTTLLKGITGELKKLGGKMILNSSDLSGLTLMEKARRVAYVPQFSDIAEITLEDYVLMGRYPYRSRWKFFETQHDMKVADEYMNLIGIQHLRDKYISRLSGGELQLASIARALTQEPELLLLDEPTSHLDITHQVQILNLIQRLNEEMGLTVLMVIHDLNLAGEYCDHLILMKEGSVFLEGGPEEVIKYNHIERVYDTVVVIQENPLSGKPVVFLVSEKMLRKTGK